MKEYTLYYIREDKKLPNDTMINGKHIFKKDQGNALKSYGRIAELEQYIQTKENVDGMLCLEDWNESNNTMIFSSAKVFKKPYNLKYNREYLKGFDNGQLIMIAKDFGLLTRNMRRDKVIQLIGDKVDIEIHKKISLKSKLLEEKKEKIKNKKT